MPYKINTIIDLENLSQYWNKDLEREINSKNVKCIESNKKYSYEFVCFNFALNDINNWLHSCEEAYEELEYKYKQIDIKQAKKGDIISYHEISDFKNKYEKPCPENALHFAVIKNIKGTLKSTIIESKWGNDGVFESTLEEVPDTYGNCIVIWRKKEE